MPPSSPAAVLATLPLWAQIVFIVLSVVAFLIAHASALANFVKPDSKLGKLIHFCAINGTEMQEAVNGAKKLVQASAGKAVVALALLSTLAFGSPALAADVVVPPAAPPAVVQVQPRTDWGILTPVFRVGFDAKGAATVGKWASGGCYAVSYRFAQLRNGVWLFSVGGAACGQLTPPATGAGVAFALTAATCLGVWNDVGRLCPSYDLVNAATAGVTGLVAGKPTLQNYGTFIGIDLTQVPAFARLITTS